MFPRHFLTLCGLVLFIAVASAAIEEPELLQNKLDESVEERNPALAIAIRVLARVFKWAAKHCLEQAAHACKQHWKNPGELIKCAGHFLQENKGRCVVG